MQLKVAVSDGGRAYADMQRVAKRYDDTTAEVLWFLDGYSVVVTSLGPISSIDDIYAAYCTTFAREHPNDSPVPKSALSAAIGSGFVQLEVMDPGRN